MFRCSVKERDKVVISNAAIELYAEIPKPKEKPAAAPAGKPGGSPVMPNSADVFAGIAAYIAKNPETVGKVKTVFAFKLKSPESTWTLDLEKRQRQRR